MRISHGRFRPQAVFRKLLIVPLATAGWCAAVTSLGFAAQPAAWTLLGPEMWANDVLQEPVAVASLSGDRFAILDKGRARVLILSRDGQILRRFGGKGTKPGEFRSPTDLAADADGSLYVLDPETFRLQKMTAEGEIVWSVHCAEGDRALRLESLAVGADGSIFAVEPSQGKVHRFAPNGDRAATWGTTGTGQGELGNPAGIAVDESGRVAVAERGNSRIQFYDSDGAFATEWLLPLTATGRALEPRDIAFFTDGRAVVLIEFPEPEVLVLDPEGLVVQRWGSTGSGRYGLRAPGGLAVTASSRVLVADTENARVQQYDLERMQAEATEAEIDAASRGGVPKFGIRYQLHVPLIDGPLSGYTGRLHIVARVQPATAVEVGIATATATKEESGYGYLYPDGTEAIVGNPYLGVVLGNPLGSWAGRIGLRLPIADDNEGSARAVAYLADPANRIVFHPSGFGAGASVERALDARPSWRITVRAGMEYFTDTEDLAGYGVSSTSHQAEGFGKWDPAEERAELWFLYGAEYLRDFGWLRARGGLVGRLAPVPDLRPPDTRREEMAFYDSTGVTYKTVPVDNPLSELQNQLYLNVDFLRSTVRPGVEVRWWIEERTREYVSWVLGFYLDYAFTVP